MSMFVRNVESMNSLQAHYSLQADLALANDNYKEAIDHVLDNSLIQHRIGTGTRHEQHIELRDSRQKKVNELALSHKGIGMNSGTGCIGGQAVIGCIGALVPILQPVSMAIGAAKSAMDEGKRGNQTVMQSFIEENKRFQDDLKGQDQASQTAIAEALSMKKQAASADHEAMRQMAN